MYSRFSIFFQGIQVLKVLKVFKVDFQGQTGDTVQSWCRYTNGKLLNCTLQLRDLLHVLCSNFGKFWYTGHPDVCHEKVDLFGVQNIVLHEPIHNCILVHSIQ